MYTKHPSHDNAGEGSASQDSAIDPEPRTVRVVLEITRGGPCVMDTIDGDILDAEVRFEDDRCRADIDVREHTDTGTKEGTKQFSSSICSHCPRDIFSKYGCIPRYLSVETGSFVVETYLTEDDSVSSFVADLTERCEDVSLRSLTRSDRTEYTEECSLDLSQLTMKQREAAHRAKKLGYYDSDSDVGIDALAEDLGISKSAASQRLTRATANVFRQLNCACECWNARK